MERHLSLIKSDFKELETRVLPRFPFVYLMFKDQNEESGHIYEVKDISFTGMQLSLKDGGHAHVPGGKISGIIQWKHAELEAIGKVKWVKGKRLGISFSKDRSFQEKIKSFLSMDKIIAGMQPLHSHPIEDELPINLKYWLRADGPFEIFVWSHSHAEMSKFQIIMLNKFVEWEDGLGIKTGEILKTRDVETPLFNEDEFLFQLQDGVEMEYLKASVDMVKNIPEKYLPAEAKEFLILKLGG